MTFSIKLAGYTGGTLDLTGNNPYYINAPGWRPAVSRIQPRGYGGDPYEDVIESVPLMIVSDSEANALDALHDLASAMSQASRWSLGENIPALLMEVELAGSGNPYKSAILGPSGDRSWMNLSPTFRRDVGAYVISPIDLSFRRRGAWLGANDQKSDLEDTANNPGIMSVTFDASVSLPSPIDLEIDVAGPVTSTQVSDIALLYAHGSDRLALLEAEDGSGTNWSTVADADASGGNVKQFTPTTLVQNFLISNPLDSDVRSAALVLNLRNLSSTITHYLRWRFSLFHSGGYSRWVAVEPDTQNPQLVFLGVTGISFGSGGGTLAIEIYSSSSGNGATDGLEIDTIGLVAMEGDADGILFVKDVGGTAGASHSDPIVEHRLLRSPTPIVRRSTRARSYFGSPFIFGYGDTFNVLVLGNQGQYWKLRDIGSPGTPLSIGLTAGRRPAYLVPK